MKPSKSLPHEQEELIQKAGQAIGYNIGFDMRGEPFVLSDGRKQTYRQDWNPLLERRDAQELVDKLRIQVVSGEQGVCARRPDSAEEQFVDHLPEKDGAFCLAVVRAAAQG